MALSDVELWEALEDESIEIEPVPDIGQIKGASIDFRLGPSLIVLPDSPIQGVTLNPSDVDVENELRLRGKLVDLESQGPHKMGPGQFVAGMTLERLVLNDLSLAAQVQGKSSLARLGLSVHLTAPKIDPGWTGRIRLEMYNCGPFTLELSHQMQICSILIERLGKPARQAYQGRFEAQGTV